MQRYALALCFFLCLVFTWADGDLSTSLPQPSSELKSYPLNTLTSDQPPTDPWSSFDESWTALKDELTAWSEDSERLSILLEGLQTEAEGLRSSLAQSIKQYESSEEARLREREAATAKIYKTEQERNAWRMLSLVAAGAAAGALAAGPIGAAVGAAAGFVLSIVF